MMAPSLQRRPQGVFMKINRFQISFFVLSLSLSSTIFAQDHLSESAAEVSAQSPAVQGTVILEAPAGLLNKIAERGALAGLSRGKERTLRTEEFADMINKAVALSIEKNGDSHSFKLTKVVLNGDGKETTLEIDATIKDGVISMSKDNYIATVEKILPTAIKESVLGIISAELAKSKSDSVVVGNVSVKDNALDFQIEVGKPAKLPAMAPIIKSTLSVDEHGVVVMKGTKSIQGKQVSEFEDRFLRTTAARKPAVVEAPAKP